MFGQKGFLPNEILIESLLSSKFHPPPYINRAKLFTENSALTLAWISYSSLADRDTKKYVLFIGSQTCNMWFDFSVGD